MLTYSIASYLSRGKKRGNEVLQILVRPNCNPIYFNPRKDDLIFYGQESLLSFVQRFESDNLLGLKDIGVNSFSLDSDALHQSERYTPSTILSKAPKAISSLYCWEVLGFACMRLGTIKVILLTHHVPSNFSTQDAIAKMELLEDNQTDAQIGLISFFDLWGKSRQSYLETYGNGCKRVILERWEIPAVNTAFFTFDADCEKIESFEDTQDLIDNW